MQGLVWVFVWSVCPTPRKGALPDKAHPPPPTKPPPGSYQEFLAATLHQGKLAKEEHLHQAFQVGLGWWGGHTRAHMRAPAHSGLNRVLTMHSLP